MEGSDNELSRVLTTQVLFQLSSTPTANYSNHFPSLAKSPQPLALWAHRASFIVKVCRMTMIIGAPSTEFILASRCCT